MTEDPQMIYDEDGEPTGHTSWGPDRPPRHTPRVEAPLGRVEAAAVPEPTEAMVEAALGAPPGDSVANDVTAMLKAAIAAAPPEWLGRFMVEKFGYVVARDAVLDAHDASRALRGGEEET